VSRLFKIFLIIALSVFSDTNLSANDTPSTIWESYDEPLELDPFQLVIFLNDSKYQIIAEGIKGSEFGEGTYLVPALFLEYTDQKKFNEDVQFAVEVGFDALTVLSSGGTLLIAKNLTTARKWWLIFEVANSSTNILINYAGIKDDPKWKKVLAAYNLVTLGLNLGELTYSAAKGLKTISNNLYKAKNIEGNFLKSTDDFIEELNDFNKAQHDLTAAEKEMLDEFEEVVEIAKRRSGSTKVLAQGVVKNVDDYKLFWNTLSDVPKTSQKQYTLWRRVDKSWEPAVTHPMQANNTVNRYSKGREAVYFGRSKEVSNAEWLSYNPTTGLRGPNGSKLYKFTVNESDLLDLTDPNVLSKLDLKTDLLTKINDKAIPQALGDWAFDNGYKGIIFPSARMSNEANVVIFKYFQGNTPPSISVTDLIETID